MKFWTTLALELFVVVFAVFLRVGRHAEETKESDDFEDKALEYGASEVELRCRAVSFYKVYF